MTLSLNGYLQICNWMKHSPIGISVLPLVFEMLLLYLLQLIIEMIYHDINGHTSVIKSIYLFVVNS